jgi:hypothetical protein
MDVDATGFRPVPGQPARGDKTVAIYGCSTVYGWSIATDETCRARLQRMLPGWRIENHGVPGYGQTHNGIQLRRDTEWDQPEYVAFGWIPDHQLRNVADIAHMRQVQYSIPVTSPVRVFPRASIDAGGRLRFGTVEARRPELLAVDVSEYRTAEYYQDLVAFQLFREADRIVRGYGGHFFVVPLWGPMSPLQNRLLAEAGIPVVETGVFGEQYQSLPDDGHANAAAHLIYADKIRAHLAAREAAP